MTTPRPASHLAVPSPRAVKSTRPPPTSFSSHSPTTNLVFGKRTFFLRASSIMASRMYLRTSSGAEAMLARRSSMASGSPVSSRTRQFQMRITIWNAWRRSSIDESDVSSSRRPTSDPSELARLEARLGELDAERATVQARIAELQRPRAAAPAITAAVPMATAAAAPTTPDAKVALFASLFRGRTDVYPRAWTNAKKGTKGYSPACLNEWNRPLCQKPRVRCGECPHQSWDSVSLRVIQDHLQGQHVIGVYPLLRDERCHLLAIDFDKDFWTDDVLAFAETCRAVGLPAAVERSRSGNGAHAWFFFEEPVLAAVARKVGCFLLTETMARRPGLGMESYDRLFPNQDTMPRGGFGNLIAVPLQHEPRKVGNTVTIAASGAARGRACERPLRAGEPLLRRSRRPSRGPRHGASGVSPRSRTPTSTRSRRCGSPRTGRPASSPAPRRRARS